MFMKIERRDYRLRDFIKIPIAFSPRAAALRVIDMFIYASIPALMVLATAGFIDTAIDIFNGHSATRQIVVPLLGILLLTAYQYISFSIMDLAKAKMDAHMSEAFRAAVTEKRAMLEYRHVENNDTWDLIERVGKDPAGRFGGGFDILLRMGGIIIRICAILSVLINRVWWAAPVILGFSAPLIWLAVKSGKTHYDESKEAAKYTRRAQYLQDVLTGRDYAEERTLFGYSDKLNNRYYEKYRAAYKINMKAQRKRYMRIKSASLITVLVSVLISGVLIAPLGSGALSVGMYMGFVTTSFGLAQMLSWELTYVAGELADNREYLRDFTAFAHLSETPGAADLPAARVNEPGCIEFRGVSFKYPETESMILKNLNLKLYAKKHYAFVGVNGAGKTTITKLLTGLYDNYTGGIYIDGKNLREFSQSELKAMFSIVYQDYAKYRIRLEDSVGIGDVNGMTEHNIVNAIETAGLTEIVSKLPEGIKTPLGKIKENGADISGGEWQRIAIARSMASAAPVHILDEPAAALDPAAESEVYKMFSRISRGKMTIFITHRLGAARQADEIFVIADGHAAEQGAHTELLRKNKLYAEMYGAQREWYA
jgi:ATP-binding cassette subfamily B protein